MSFVALEIPYVYADISEEHQTRILSCLYKLDLNTSLRIADLAKDDSNHSLWRSDMFLSNYLFMVLWSSKSVFCFSWVMLALPTPRELSGLCTDEGGREQVWTPRAFSATAPLCKTDPVSEPRTSCCHGWEMMFVKGKVPQLTTAFCSVLVFSYSVLIFLNILLRVLWLLISLHIPSPGLKPN